ncbi:hypothetical protein ACFFMN_07565 [Planobispora siamensis]|uniref:Lipoprotein n=1 Tax=Planobispora siamensis TaxID=936338 RepID=A0A8J3WK14_9ACTN|nr:hypothetical protein [Planobispora siamensis]GIH90346.1 hypothetical protein Psi01_09760 [Planobispora siamensis]
MKRVIAGAVAAVAITSVAAAPAQAASADPVKALESRLVAGKGVKFTDITTLVEFQDNRTPFLRRTGSFQFGKGTIVASEVSVKRTSEATPDEWFSYLPQPGDKPERTIRIGTTSYYSGGRWRPSKGKTWIKHRDGMSAGLSGEYSQQVNAAEPATLKALMAKGKRTGRTYSGKITFGALDKVSPWARNSGEFGRLKGEASEVLHFTLTLGSDHLPERLVVLYPWPTRDNAAEWEKSKISVETRYTGWGSRVSVKAPPAAKTMTVK